ncbi:MAG: hypothetical protein PHF24_06580 [Syntrophomonas sp.]|nr:hypothetical protein [Syntrophomonas sp.]
MSRCAYCKKEGASKKTAVHFWIQNRQKIKELDYCSEACKQKIHKFAVLQKTNANRFTGFVLLWMIAALIIPLALKTITGNPIFFPVGALAMLGILGLIITIYPLGLSTNTKLVEKIGIKYMAFYFRITGILLVVSAFVMIKDRI